MVNERPMGAASSSAPKAVPKATVPVAQAAIQPRTQTQRPPSNPITDPSVARAAEPVAFGQASPLRNPLQPNNLFNPNPRRPEHHRPSPPSGSRGSGNDGQTLNIRNIPTSSQWPQQSSARPIVPSGPAARNGFYLPGQKRQDVQQSNAAVAISADFFEISKPTNPTFKTIQPAPRPMFSSLGPRTTFQPFIPPSRITVDLTKDEDGSNPDAGLADQKFGAMDPYTYVDPSKASENIKALLEGAFDSDDGDKPKRRLRKNVKKAEKAVQDKKTQSLAEKLSQLEVKDDEKATAAAAQEDDVDDDEEDGTVEGMTVKLLPHQVDGVSWMMDKEIGVRKNNCILPKGGILADDMGLGKTIQSVTLILSNPRPALDAKPDDSKRKMPGPEVGKGTLVVAPLALIKQWEAEIKSKVESSHALRVLVHHGATRTKSFLELKKYDVVITTYQILASEHAGSTDHADGLKVGCFGVHWYRVILDEAHSIKNRNAKSTQACYALRSWYRWCLTGTPMQNNLDELQSLICFLKIKPYNELSQWKAHITTPMKSGRGQYAIKRVQYFLKAFMKRRTKDILKKDGALNFGGKGKGGEKSSGMQIVERKIEHIVCKLDPGERAFYDKLSERAESRLKDMMKEKRSDYIGALVLLLRLRQACNHPQLIESAMSKDKDALSTAGMGDQSPRKGSKADDVDDLADMLGGLGVTTKSCDVCQVKLDSDEVAEGKVRCADCEKDLALTRQPKKHSTHSKSKRSDQKPRPKMKNRRVLADSDDEDEEHGGDWLVSPPQQQRPGYGKAGGSEDEDAEGGGRSLGSIDSDTEDEESEDGMKERRRREQTDPTSNEDGASSSDSDSDSGGGFRRASGSGSAFTARSSTKIRHLLRILHAEIPTDKVIVFSQFTSMLDLIEPHLKHKSIRYVRYDGSMKNDAREASLNSLRNEKGVRVLLCSLKCGSLGLNLTAASRVVIVEPFWNPFVEEQAIDRVHRLNQTRDVKVYKLTVEDTVEERILELQEKKRDLAKAAIEGGKAVAKLSMQDLLGLFGGNPEAALDVDAKNWASTNKQTGLVKNTNTNTVHRPVAAYEREQQLEHERRRKQAEKGRGRISNEDPVYGRR